MLDILETHFELGQAVPVPSPSVELQQALATRRSASAMCLSAPGPSSAEIDRLLTLAARAPDHGKLTPWRFVVIQGEAKDELVRKLEVIAAARPDATKAGAALGKLRIPPLCIAVVSRPVIGHKIPEWEQVLSAGAVCMNLLLAANAGGYGANWITDWYAYDQQALGLVGVQEGERIAGYVHIGTLAEPSLERVRPDLAEITSRLGACG